MCCPPFILHNDQRRSFSRSKSGQILYPFGQQSRTLVQKFIRHNGTHLSWEIWSLNPNRACFTLANLFRDVLGFLPLKSSILTPDTHTETSENIGISGVKTLDRRFQFAVGKHWRTRPIKSAVLTTACNLYVSSVAFTGWPRNSMFHILHSHEGPEDPPIIK